jgi:hypothetical protein
MSDAQNEKSYINESILNIDFIRERITNNLTTPTPYRWSHGATDTSLGDGIIVYGLIQYMQFKNCVCIGSGGGFIPRIMTQARIDLHRQKIFKGNPDYNWGDIGATYLVDPCNGVGGDSDIDNEDGFFRNTFYPRFIKASSKDAYYDFFVRHDIKIDILFIDGDHSYDGVKEDFTLYTNLLTENGVVIIHDTDTTYEKTLIISEDAKKDYYGFAGPFNFIEELKEDGGWDVLTLHNFIRGSEIPSSTGITLINKRKK